MNSYAHYGTTSTTDPATGDPTVLPGRARRPHACEQSAHLGDDGHGEEGGDALEAEERPRGEGADTRQVEGGEDGGRDRRRHTAH